MAGMPASPNATGIPITATGRTYKEPHRSGQYSSPVTDNKDVGVALTFDYDAISLLIGTSVRKPA
jgi:hypothetical protein